MTVVKHPFECPERTRFRRFKQENLIEQTSFKVTRFCQAAVKPVRHPQSPLPQQPREYAIPAHSRWFDFKKIHKIERCEFPELADPALERIYRRVRNRAVKIFRLYPTYYVTLSVLRHINGGDLEFIQKIHRFLSKWGLINYMSAFRDTSSEADDRCVKEFGVITDKTPPQKLDVLCWICRAHCGDGHFISRKYLGNVICPLCFSHHLTLDQLGLPHSAFEYRELPNRQVQLSGDMDKKMLEEFERTKGDWQAISDSLDPGQKRGQVASPVDCMIAVLRSSMSDMVTPKQATTHEFHDEEPMAELLELAQRPNPATTPETTLRSDWHELEGEVALIEEEVMSCIGH